MMTEQDWMHEVFKDRPHAVQEALVIRLYSPEANRYLYERAKAGELVVHDILPCWISFSASPYGEVFWNDIDACIRRAIRSKEIMDKSIAGG